MTRRILSIWIAISLLSLCACGTAYKARPLPFKTPASYQNAITVSGAQIGARAYVNATDAKEAFGFDIRGAGMLPVQLVFDNLGNETLDINPGQTFLEDQEGNLWPILTDKFAYQRATKYAQTNKIFKEGAYAGFLGATAGAVIGAAVGIVTGEDVARTAGEGAIIGGAGGAVLGGAAGAAQGQDARAEIIGDLRDKSLENKSVSPNGLSHGIIFFPGEAKSAKQLRLQIIERGSGKMHTVFLKF